MTNQVLMTIEKNVDAGILKSMRVVKINKDQFLVQTVSSTWGGVSVWKIETEWTTARDALQSCVQSVFTQITEV